MTLTRIWLNEKAVYHVLIPEFYVSPSNPSMVIGNSCFSHRIVLMIVAEEGVLSSYITLNNKAPLQETCFSIVDMDQIWPNLLFFFLPHEGCDPKAQVPENYLKRSCHFQLCRLCIEQPGEGPCIVLRKQGCLDSGARWRLPVVACSVFSFPPWFPICWGLSLGPHACQPLSIWRGRFSLCCHNIKVEAHTNKYGSVLLRT